MIVPTLRPTHVAGAAAIAIGAMLAGRAIWPASASGSALEPASNVAVNCEPGQQALVRQTVVKGEPHVAIQCATALGIGAPIGYAPEFAHPLAGDPRLIPANYVVAAEPTPARLVSRLPVTRTVASSTRTGERRRSWQKTALVIGGSAGAGAGIGAIVGGKKGALIGAAIGGGGAGLYEAMKRR
jgi:uncharacterized protein YcfJ